MRTRSSITAIAAAGVLILGAAGCSSSGGATAPTQPPTQQATSTSSAAPTTSAAATPPMQSFAKVTPAQDKKLEQIVPRLAGVNNTAYYKSAHRLDVYFKTAATSKQRAAVKAAVDKQQGN